MSGATLALTGDHVAEELLRWAYAFVLAARPSTLLRLFVVGLLVLLALALRRWVARCTAHDRAEPSRERPCPATQAAGLGR
ncbi:MAG TPA: hypothetical protein VKW76_00070 [Candidatus Binatia bacterium]|nr:hypothetical protein [Candidatus Binatia bacterium]